MRALTSSPPPPSITPQAAKYPIRFFEDFSDNQNEWFAGINHEFAAVTMSFGDAGTFGLSVTGLYTDEMLVRTPLQPEGTGETFYGGNYRFGLSYARYLTDRVTVGATVSYISMTLYEGFSADAMSADIAAYYVSDFRGFRFGIQISHFVSEVKYVNESYPLPTNFTFGVAINAVEADAHKVIVALAALKRNEGPPLAQGGLEWNFNDMFFLRGGYKFNHSVADYALGGGAAALILGLR